MDDKVKKSITIDKEVEESIKQAAKEDGRKFSNMVNKILIEFAEDWKKRQKK